MIETLLIVFVLAAFVGFEVISKVPATLHTPLMSGANAISGITIVGALVVAGMVPSPVARWLGFGALVLASINVVGGYLVTDRMLQMFRKREPAPGGAPAGRTDA
jgi:H+-translocating NAD(P) transhydrogenase subunit alpha